MINYKIIKINDSALKILGKDNRQLNCINDGKMYFSKKVVSKQDRSEKQLTKSQEFIEFAKLYPKKSDLSSDKLIEKYNKLAKEGKHKEILEGLNRYIRYIEVEKTAPKFIKNAYTWINANGWENEYKLLENRFGYNKKFISDMLDGLESKRVEKILDKIKEREARTKKEITEGVVQNIIDNFNN